MRLVLARKLSSSNRDGPHVLLWILMSKGAMSFNVHTSPPDIAR